MKKQLLAVTALLIFATSTKAQNCLADWQYMMPITIDNSGNSDTLWNYQVKMYVNTQTLVTAGHMNSNGSDIRFTNGNCCGMLCYAIDSNMNTQNTLIWVNVPMIPANGTATLHMAYGNTNATAGANPGCTFDFWEDFNSNNYDLTLQCGSPSISVGGSNLGLKWNGGIAVFTANKDFPSDTAYTGEMHVNSISAESPGIYWNRESDHMGYSCRAKKYDFDESARIGYAVDNSYYCRSGDDANTPQNFTSEVGIWGITWAATGDIKAQFPTVGQMTSGNVDIVKQGNLKLCIGAIEGPAGKMDLGWLRARKYTAIPPTTTFGTEEDIMNTVSLGNDTGFCANNSVTLDAGAGWNSYQWSNNETSQTANYNTAGTQYVEVENNANCTVTDTIELTAYPLPASSFTSTNTGLDYDFTSGNTGAVTWYWDFDDSNNSTQQNPTHTFATPGIYNVCHTVTDANGCDSTYCEIVNADYPIGISTIENGNGFSVWPNPFNAIVNVRFAESGAAHVRLSDITGKTVYTQTANASMVEINTAALESGIYFLTVEKEKSTKVQKIIKR